MNHLSNNFDAHDFSKLDENNLNQKIMSDNIVNILNLYNIIATIILVNYDITVKK